MEMLKRKFQYPSKEINTFIEDFLRQTDSYARCILDKLQTYITDILHKLKVES